MRTQMNFRLPVLTIEQIELIAQTYGLTHTQIIILAVDRLAAALNPETGNPAIIAQAEQAAAN